MRKQAFLKAMRTVCETLEDRLLLSGTIYVDASAPGLAPDGSSWESAFVDLQQALAAAGPGDTIRVAGGTYKPTSGTNRNATFQLKSGVALYGGYAGYAAADPDARDVAANQSILSGDIGTQGSDADNSYHVVSGSGTDVTAVLDAFTVIDGTNAVYTYDGSPTINGCTFSHANGPSIYNSYSSPSIVNCVFRHNNDSCILNLHSSPVIQGCEFTAGYASVGSGVYSSFSSPTIIDCTFQGNIAGAYGGAVYSADSNSTVANCTFQTNRADYGGGLYNIDGALTLVNCVFAGNVASEGAGLCIVVDPWSEAAPTSQTLTNCTFSGNSADRGGAISSGGDLLLTNCIVWGNAASLGPGVLSSNESVAVMFSDIQGGWDGTGNIEADPLMIPLPVPGIGESINQSLHLRAGSPCIDAGTNAAVPASTTRDAAGDERFYDVATTPDTGLGTGPIVDMGAFECSDVFRPTLYVDAMADGNGSGTTWTDAISSLGWALLLAVPGQSVRVAGGTYNPTSSDDRSATFRLISGVRLEGGYAGNLGTDPDRRDVRAYPTVLSGNIADPRVTYDNSYHVVTASGTDATAILDGFTITAGHADAWYPDAGVEDGGGMYNAGGSPTIINCTFTANDAVNGGGLFTIDGDPTLINCIFTENSAASGAGMRNGDGAPHLINCIFSDNSADTGGAVATWNSLPSMAGPEFTNCTITSNAAAHDGGAIACVGSLTITNCILWENTAPNGPELSAADGTLGITYSDVQGGMPGEGNIDADPLFMPEPAPGVGAPPDQHLRLRGTSPCIDAGNNAALAVGVSVDADGNPRVHDVPGIIDTGIGTGPIVDMGAFECNDDFTGDLYVDASATGDDSGADWANAMTSLAWALQVATPGQSIRVGPGLYTPTSLNDRKATFQLKNGVRVEGGYAGLAGQNPDARSVGDYPAILTGNIGAPESRYDNSYHVVNGSGTDSTAVLDGFTITAGLANAPYYVDPFGESGAGIFNRGGSPAIINCRFAGNTAAYGGGMYNDSASAPVISNCAFIGNIATDGAGMYSDASSPLLISCSFSGNSGSNGPAIAASDSTLTLTNCTVSGNSLTIGGMLDLTGGSTVLTNCILWGGTAAHATIPTQISGDVSTLTATYCDIQGGWDGIGNINSPPRFIRDPSPGDDTKWGTSDDDFGDLQLLAYSPCIDAGSNMALPESITTDLSGGPRFRDSLTIPDTGFGTAPIVDMGAYECSAILPPVVYVDAGAAGANTGENWTDAFTSLAVALEHSAPGQAIRVAGGVYTPTASTDRAATFKLVSRLELYGGYAGHQAAEPDTRDITLYETILSGDIGTPGSNADNSYHVVTGSGTDATAVLNGFSIIDGYANASNGSGAGMYNDAGSPTVVNCTFRNNQASGNGAGMYNFQSSPTLIGCVFSGQKASFRAGAAIFNDGSSPSLTGCSFVGNVASSGGAIYNTNSSPTFDRCEFRDNKATVFGGAIAIFGSTSSPVMTDCTFTGNSTSEGGAIYAAGAKSLRMTRCTFTSNSASMGGAFRNSSSSVALNQCVFTENSASISGGAINSDFGSLTLADCIFIRNSTRSWASGGGGITTYDTSTSLNNCTFVGNTGGYVGGGIDSISHTELEQLRLVNCVFAGNSAESGGGAIVASMASLIGCTFSGNSAMRSGGAISASSASLINCIVWDNSAVHDAEIDSQGAISASYCDIRGGWEGAGNIDADPSFLRMPSPGPDGAWGTADDDYGDLRLQACSPATDAGSNDALAPDVTTDLAGDPRFQDIPTTPDTGSGTAPIVDMGAYEAAPALACSAGGPYVAIEDRPITLSGHGASDVSGPLVYEWEWSGDGQFDEAVGAEVPFPIAGLPPGTDVPLSLRVTDANSRSIVNTTTLHVFPAILYVDAGAAGSNDGSSWANAATSLAPVLAAAVAGEEIRVAGGTYRPTDTTDRNATFQLKNGVAIYGAYAGSAGADPGVRNLGLYRSVLSGDIGSPGTLTDNSILTVTGSGTDASAILDGFTITGGYGIYGGMYSYYGNPSVSNCAFVGNLTTGHGAGISNTESTSTFTNCLFAGNASSTGGAISNIDSSITLINCTFISNTAKTGGAIYSSGTSVPILTNCILWNNSAPTDSQYSGAGSITYSDIQGGWAGDGNIDADPGFLRMPSPGPDGAWGTADDDYGDLRLRSGSPCIDAGNSDAIPPGITTDLAGRARQVDIPSIDDTGTGTAPIVDMGAFERTLAGSVAGLEALNSLLIRMSSGGSQIEFVDGAAPDGGPALSLPAMASDAWLLETSDADHALVVDLSNGAPSADLFFAPHEGVDTLLIDGLTPADSLDIRPGLARIDPIDLAFPQVQSITLDATGGNIALSALSVAAPVALGPDTECLRAAALSISGEGQLDLAGASLIIDYAGPSPIEQLRQWVQNGRMGILPAIAPPPTPLGQPALGFVDNALLHLPDFASQALAAPFGQVLVRSTLAGDVDLDGMVTQADLRNIIANMGLTQAQWFQGDVNCDGIVGIDDFAEVAAHLGDGQGAVGAVAPVQVPSALATARLGMTSASLPEPEPEPQASVVQQPPPFPAPSEPQSPVAPSSRLNSAPPAGWCLRPIVHTGIEMLDESPHDILHRSAALSMFRE